MLLEEGSWKTEGAPFGLWPTIWFGTEGQFRYDALAGSLPDAEAGFPSTGIYTLSGSRDSKMILDAGPLGPDFLPGHAHADTLSFELSAHDMGFVVDSGVGEHYGEQAWRDYERGTAAHNTIEIDGKNQSDVYGQFRVGERARATGVGWFSEEDVSGVRAAHDGYRRLPEPATHTRTFVRIGVNLWVVVDEITGTGSHRSVGRIHFHPECAVEKIGDLAVRASRGGKVLRVTWAPGVELGLRSGERDPIQGWYAPEFGKRMPSTVVEATAEGQVPQVMTMVIRGEDEDVVVGLDRAEGLLSIGLETAGGRRSLSITNVGVDLDGRQHPFHS